ncbi:MAG: insulinase family protein [Bacteroidia bacterium]|nr:insulinase family protein [Bacteroidia bacterium]
MHPIAPYVWYWRRPYASSIYALCMWNVGSRHDPPTKEGLLHFLEHSLFKGTERRTGRAIFRLIESVGGELNAFTTKDKIGLEVRTAPTEIGTALLILYELAFRATFPDSEVEKEREVILEELAMYEDIPEEALLDHFEEQIFTEGGLRHPIIGYKTSVRSITPEDLRLFYRDRLQTSPFVLLLTGPLSERDILRSLTRSGWSSISISDQSIPPPTTSEKVAPPLIRHAARHTQQVHLIIGGIAPTIYEWEESIPVQLLLHRLAGGMSSRLSLILREKHGWTYSVYSFYHSYPEKAIWGIYTGLMPEAFRRARLLIQAELNRLMDKPLSSRQLSELSRSFLGKQTLLWESSTYRIQAYSRSLLDVGRLIEESEWKDAIKAITPARLQEAAIRTFGQLYEWAYVPKEPQPHRAPDYPEPSLMD